MSRTYHFIFVVRSARLSHAQVQIDWLRISGEMYGATTTRS